MSDETKPGIDVRLSDIAANVEKRFHEGRRVLSFGEYLDLFMGDPTRYARDASRYLRDAFDHYGARTVREPYGEFTRYNLFDLPWEKADGASLPKGALVGQESVQEELYRILSNFAREGKPNRLVLLHGPNGSAKSTIVGCTMAALEDYSTRPEGALYCFSWVFPSSKTIRGSLGFAQKDGLTPASLESYAYLPDDQVDAKLLVEVRDHPLFLVPVADRKVLLEKAFAAAKKNGDARAEPPPDWVVRGTLSHKSQQVFEALLAGYKGSYADVLKHVQVERYFISRRYRIGAVTIGPQMSVDAGERQLTADRSLSALPPSLQALTLYEAKGELVEAAGGILEFSDLLKRPLDAFKYLQLSIETAEVALTQQNVQLNCVMLGSANELHLDAFREHPEFASFRGRIELIRAGYLRSYKDEQTLYDGLVIPQVQRHVAPHASKLAAMFAVLTRMRKPNAERFSRQLGAIAGSLTAFEKADLYAEGRAPERLDADGQKVLRASVRELYDESESYPVYEGRIGASPRELRVVLLDAAQSTKFACLSPLAVLDELAALCTRKNEFEWLQQESLPGNYHDVKAFLETLLERLLGYWETELYASTGLVEEARYAELYERYVQQVSVWVKKERFYNRVLQRYEEPDEKLMVEVERLLGAKGDSAEFRRQLISGVAAWALDHPDQKVETAVVFAHHVRHMRDTVYAEKKRDVAFIARDIVLLVQEDGTGLDDTRRRAAEATIATLVERHGYCRRCVADLARMLVRKRFHDLVG